ncbi:hypothetical protein KC19_1G118400 [Ceratodon purpureus]|uniref:TPD1 protein homolog 1-like n=1 Tax=Ceratodon purpureus TaxID=3225 RepID=A0A8T0J564_CERPU|nr:hypothetical protein KC19_1G118400 [Ceratodon purpureus]
MPQLPGANGNTSMAVCTLLLILLSPFFKFAEGLCPGLPRRLNNSQSILNFNNSEVVNQRSSHTDRTLRIEGIFPGTSCSNRDISIFQGRDSPANGIPQYSVQISNNCISCDPWNIHIFCGSFASARATGEFQQI